LGDGRKMTVADMASAHKTTLKENQQLKTQEVERRERDKLLSIREGLAKRNFVADSIALVADGIAGKIVTGDDGKLLAKGVQIKNPLPDSPVPTLTKDLSLDEYLDLLAGEQKHLVGAKLKPGTGSGGGDGTGGAGEGEFTAEKALADPKVAEAWEAKDPDGFYKAMQEHTDAQVEAVRTLPAAARVR